MDDALLNLLPGGAQTLNVAVASTAVTAYGVAPNPNGNALDLKTLIGLGNNSRRLNFRTFYSQALVTNGTGTLLFSIDHADDNGGTPGAWQLLRTQDEGVIALTTTATSGYVHLQAQRTKRWIRLNALMSGSGVSVTATRALGSLANP